MHLKTRIEGMVSSLGRTKPELAKGILKWENYILKAVSKVSKVTGQDEEDVLGEIFLGVVKVDEIYTSDMCRYKGANYKIIGTDGPLVVHLRTLDSNSKLRRDFWTSVCNIQRIETGKLESSIYREVRNQYLDMLNSNFTQKRGYSRKLAGTRISPKTGKARPLYEVSGAPYFVDVEIPSDLEDARMSGYPSLSEISDYLCSRDPTPEDCVLLWESVEELSESLSPDAMCVLGYLMENPGMSCGELSKESGLSRMEVNLARNEIVRGYLAWISHPKLSEEVSTEDVDLPEELR